MRFVLFFFWQFRPQFTLNPLLFRDLTVSPRWIRKIHYETTIFADKAEYHLLFPDFTLNQQSISNCEFFINTFFSRILNQLSLSQIDNVFSVHSEFTMESLSPLRIH